MGRGVGYYFLSIKEDLITVTFAGNTTEINSTLENM